MARKTQIMTHAIQDLVNLEFDMRLTESCDYTRTNRMASYFFSHTVISSVMRLQQVMRLHQINRMS